MNQPLVESNSSMKSITKQFYYYSIESTNAVPYRLSITSKNCTGEPIEIIDGEQLYLFYSCRPVRDDLFWVVKFYKVIDDSVTNLENGAETLINGKVGVPIIMIIDSNTHIGNGLGCIGIAPYRGMGRSKSVLMQIFNIIQDRNELDALSFNPVQRQSSYNDLANRQISQMEYSFAQPDELDLNDLILPENGTVIGDSARRIAELYGCASVKIIISRGKKRSGWLQNATDFFGSSSASKIKYRNEDTNKIEMLDLLNMQEKDSIRVYFPVSRNRPTEQEISTACVDAFILKQRIFISHNCSENV